MTGTGRLRLLVVNWLDGKNPRAGGAEVHLHEVFGRLARRGHGVTILASGWPGLADSEEWDGLRIVRSGRRYTFGLTAPGTYRRHLANEPFDVVVEDLNKVPMFTPAWTGPRRHAFIVHHLFGATAFAAGNPVLAGATWLLERTVPRLLHGHPCVAVSPSTRDDLIARGVDPEYVDVIPNGVTLSPAQRGDRFPTPTGLYLGRLAPYKGLDLALRAVARAREQGVRLELVVAGKGEDRSRLEEVARRLDLASQVRFAGHVSEDEKRRLMEGAWFHVYPSPKEGWGLSNLEAAERSTPAIVSDSPGLRDTVQVEPGRETGVIVPHGDVDALARAMVDLTDPGTRERMGRNARAFAESLSWDRVADQYEAWLVTVSSSPLRRKAPAVPSSDLTSSNTRKIRIR
ncbi:MAG: glycosyltransferase family 4 protein [Gemmatimonadetes bacterium]|nr:glycosyltransferase family 4 protein [Gemmatimonadota bacterium]